MESAAPESKMSPKMSPKMKPKMSNEAKVGALVLGTAILAVAFAWMIGIQNPFDRTVNFYVTYNFAGGIEVGSPVRVSGIKVGKVEKIDFFVPLTPEQVALKEPGSADDGIEKSITPLRVQISVRKDAAVGVKKDSRFYINLAGIIGERYIEITPGSIRAPKIQAGELVAGVDPPRIDQLISQSFDLAGKITELIQSNKGDITKSIEMLYKLSGNLNQTLAWVDKSAIFKTDLSKLIDNLIVITTDVRKLTAKTNTPEGEKTLKLMHDLLWRLEPLDSKRIKEFFQEEGIATKVKFF
ncbi:MAG: MCE family protein [Methylotenera sp.]|nr:MCE family protein [Oligoflexia bacterium]